MNPLKQLILKMDFLNEEIEIIESRIEPHDCGHLKTAVSEMKQRVKEIKQELYDWNEYI